MSDRRVSLAVPGALVYSTTWHRAFGLHSGVPACCVEEWVRTFHTGRCLPHFRQGYGFCAACAARYVAGEAPLGRLVLCGRSCPFAADMGAPSIEEIACREWTEAERLHRTRGCG